MILSSEDIKNYLRTKDIDVTNLNENSFRPSSICLTLGRIFTFEQCSNVVDVNDRASYPVSTEVDDFVSGFILPPKGFILGFTFEEIYLSREFQGALSNISGLARLGLDTIGSSHVAAGFGAEYPKSLVLEIFNKSTWPIKLQMGMRVCHLTIYKQNTASLEGYDSISEFKYGNERPDSKY